MKKEFSSDSKDPLRGTSKYQIVDIGSEPLVLNVNVSERCNKDNLPFYLIDMAKERGYAKIRMFISGNQWMSSKDNFVVHGFRPVSVNESVAHIPLPVNMTVEAKIPHENLLGKKILNPLDYFEAAAKLSIPEIIHPESFVELTARKKNITTRIGNPPMGVIVNTNLDYLNHYLHFSHSLAVEGFVKIQDFYWTNSGRYLTCVISTRPGPIAPIKPAGLPSLRDNHRISLRGSTSAEPVVSIHYPHRTPEPDLIGSIISSTKTPKEKLLQICEDPEIKYAHLRHFMEGVAIEDLEGFN